MTYVPGSLLARVLVNRYHALQKRYGPRTKQPGRLSSALKAWFYNWEGLLIGGVFVGGLAATAAKILLHERLDDLARRGERCRLYDASCSMAASHLAAVQSSLMLYRALLDIAAQRHAWQQQYRLMYHQQRTQLAAAQVALWQDRAVRWTGQPLPAAQGAWQPPEQQLHQQNKQEEDQQQHVQQGDQQQQQEEGGQAEGNQEQQQQQAERQDQQDQQQQHQHHHQQQQPQSPPSSRAWRQPVRLYCAARLQQAHQWLADEQAALQHAEQGAQLWLQLGKHAKSQVEKLQHHEQQQLRTLMSHGAQLAAWQAVSKHWHTPKFELWLDLPEVPSLSSSLASRLHSSQQRAATADEPQPPPPAAAAAAGGDQAQAASGQHAAAAAGGGMQRLWAVWHRGGTKGPAAAADVSSSSSTTAEASTSPTSSSSSSRPHGRWVRLRVLWPHWIPHSLDERDYDLLCHDSIVKQPTGGSQPEEQGQPEEQQQPQAARQARDLSVPAEPDAVDGEDGDADDEIELEGGGVLAEVFDEALDVVQALWDAAE